MYKCEIRQDGKEVVKIYRDSENPIIVTEHYYKEDLHVYFGVNVSAKLQSVCYYIDRLKFNRSYRRLLVELLDDYTPDRRAVIERRLGKTLTNSAGRNR